MKLIKTFSILILALLSSNLVYSQGAKYNKANTTYEAGQYEKAIDLFKEAFEVAESREKKTEIIFKIGDCFRHVNDPEHAELWFKKAIDREYQNPLVFLYYADALKMNEKYKDALDQYRRYKDLVPDDPRGENGVQSCNIVPKWIEFPNGYQVENMKFFNSKDDDYCPTYGRSDYMVVYFTSSRKAETTNNSIQINASGQNPVLIYSSKQDKKDKWSDPVALGEEINSEAEVGSPNMNKTFTVLYYGVCKRAKNKKDICQIYSSKISGESFSKAEPLAVVPDSVVASHPAISPDELTLYFVSDMPGGIGGKDIWMVNRVGIEEDWGTPENLGSEINTPSDEMFPYVHADGTLYFSSNGLPGMGGLDIFKAKKKADGHWNVENMRYPINSSSDDFGIVFKNEEEKGFFSSTRNKNDDIYSFVLPPLKFNIEGIVKDEKTDQTLSEAKIKIIGSDGITTEISSLQDGSFKYMLKPNTDYVFIASRQGYLNGKKRETTKGESKSKDFKTTITLTSIAKPIELPNIFYDFAKWDLRPESMIALDKLVETLNDNPNIVIELGSHTDSRGNDVANMELSQKRAQSVVDYLIEKGIASDRLVAKGYGKSKPKEVDSKLNEQYTFLPVGTALTEQFINKLTADQQEFAHQINRRTEFRVLRTDYIPKK
jgi:peptidoglycan-associated lipoprotein